MFAASRRVFGGVVWKPYKFNSHKRANDRKDAKLVAEVERLYTEGMERLKASNSYEFEVTRFQQSFSTALKEIRDFELARKERLLAPGRRRFTA